MDYRKFQKYFKNKYSAKKDLWDIDDVEVVDYSGLDKDGMTLCYAIPGKDMDLNYNILDPNGFSEKIFNAFRKRYGDDKMQLLFDCTLPTALTGKYPEIAKQALMTNNGTHGFDLYFTNNTVFNFSQGLYGDGFTRTFDISEEVLAELIDVKINSIYLYETDHNIILIHSNTTSYLTDLETIANYIKKPIKETYNIIFAPKLQHEQDVQRQQELAIEMSNTLSNIGLTIIKTNGFEAGYWVQFRFPNGDEGLLRKLNNEYQIEQIVDNRKKWLNDLCHFVFDWFDFNSEEDALNTLEKYIIKHRGE